MAKYAIMRCAKIKTMGSMASALQHCYRERETPNANDARTAENEHRLARSTDEAMGKLRAQLPDKYRKDAVLAVEYVFTASPEWFAKNGPQAQQEFFNRSVDWLAEKYGKDRIVTATIHNDETTPHLSAFVVPLTPDGRLSAKEFIGGRDKMRQDQTTFAATVADLGLERGIEASGAKHQTVQQFYRAINQGQEDKLTLNPALFIPQKTGLLSKESPDQIAKRVEGVVNHNLQPTFYKASVTRATMSKLKWMEETIGLKQEALERAEKRIKAAEAPMQGLKPKQKELVTKLIETMRKENQEERRLSLQRSRSRGFGYGD